jgi:hypothetical protein
MICANLSLAYQQYNRQIIRNSVKPSPRRIIANVLIVIFFAITISPLANLSMRFAVISHAITGECTGDCDTCGCLPERRALHTCCCQNKLKKRDRHNEQVTGCCKKRNNKQTPAVSQACPCGKGKKLALWEKEEFLVLPYHFSENIALLCEDMFLHDAPDRLVGRNVKPPVPPPELSIRLLTTSGPVTGQ